MDYRTRAHEGIIHSSKWLQVQELLFQNKSKSFRKVKSLHALLSGLLVCKQCGSFMRPRQSRINKDGEVIYYYMCELKEISKKMKCDVKNINGLELDKIIVNEIKQISQGNTNISEQILKDNIDTKQNKKNLNKEKKQIENSLKNNEVALKNLVKNLESTSNELATKSIFNRIEEIEKQNVELKTQLLELNDNDNNNISNENTLSMMKDLLNAFPSLIESANINEKRKLIRSIISKITWDGTDINLEIFGTPVNTQKKSFR